MLATVTFENMAFARINFSAFGTTDPMNVSKHSELHFSQDICKVERKIDDRQEVMEMSRVKISMDKNNLNMHSKIEEISLKSDCKIQFKVADVVSCYELDIETDYVYSDLLPDLSYEYASLYTLDAVKEDFPSADPPMETVKTLLGSDQQQHPDRNRQSNKLSTTRRRLKRTTIPKLSVPDSNMQTEPLERIDQQVMESPQPKQISDFFQMCDSMRQMTDLKPATSPKRFFSGGHWHYDRAPKQSKLQNVPGQQNSRKQKRKQQPDVEDPSSKRRCFINNHNSSTKTPTVTKTDDLKRQNHRLNPNKFQRKLNFGGRQHLPGQNQRVVSHC